MIRISEIWTKRRALFCFAAKKNLKAPYYTLEVTWDGEISQFYAAYDRQPSREKIWDVLKKFTASVKRRNKKMQAAG